MGIKRRVADIVAAFFMSFGLLVAANELFSYFEHNLTGILFFLGLCFTVGVGLLIWKFDE